MNTSPPHKKIAHSSCPHDCPSTCALDVEVLDGKQIGRLRGSRQNSYTAGVICAKVARYSERIHHPDRLLYPLRRSGPKGSGQFSRISWDEALDEITAAFLAAEKKYGSQAVWPYYFAGTMGLLMRDGINRLRHAKEYSRFHGTICTSLPASGFTAGTGAIRGVDPREMAKSDLVVLWGTNAASTQVNVMTHAMRARKERGAKIAVVDVYRNKTMEQADIAILLRPGTDGAFACAVMHVLFRDGLADRDYMQKHTDAPDELEAHLKSRTPDWASAITGVSVAQIEEFAQAVGKTPRTFIRLGYGFTRQRNGAVNMHAALSIAIVTGAWAHEGGGALYNNGAIYHRDKTLIEGLDKCNPEIRILDQSRIGAILTGDPIDLAGGPPVTALLIQNTNPMVVAPHQDKVKRGFAREDLFVCVHEQFMTETAKMADIVLPATMFLEHNDLYQSGGHQHIQLGLKIIEPPGECRSNHALICDLAHRVGARHPGFEMSEREIIDQTLQKSGWGTLEELCQKRWIDAQPDFTTSHYINGFAFPDGKFRFKPDWSAVTGPRIGGVDDSQAMPRLPDHWSVIEETDGAHPFRLATSPSRGFLNTTFSETATSQKQQPRPEVLVHSKDAAALNITDGAKVKMGNQRGTIVLHARLFDGVCRGVLICEGIYPNSAFEDGNGINTLTGDDAGAPIGGAVFHDNHVWLRPV